MPVTLPPFEANPGLVELSLRIGGHVRTRRQARGMSRRMLSKNSGVSERYLAQLETGNGNVTIGILHRLSLVFGCSVEDLIGGGPEPNLEKSHRIALLGVRGGGKTTLGKTVSSKHSIPFIEISNQVKAVSGMDVGEVISLYGQEGFRRYEEEAIASIIEDYDKVIIAIGGGIVETAENYNLLLRHFHTIWIKTSAAEHISRVRAQGDERPMAGFAAAEEHLANMLSQREAEFSRADLGMDTSRVPVECSVAKLTELISSNAIF